LTAIPIDPRVAQIARLFDHLVWADAELARAMARPNAPADAVREYAHVAGSGEVWLSRIEHRKPTAAIWPELSAADAATLTTRSGVAYKALVNKLNDATLDAPIKYTNSAGKTFATPLGDILIHVAMHAQYHRGKVNQMLRQSGAEPAPVDFISFVRGVPAATQATAKK
jgi:uncharacterized damage-inducible protein DinB